MGAFAKRHSRSLALLAVFVVALVIAHFAQPAPATGYDPILGPNAQTEVVEGDAPIAVKPPEPVIRHTRSKAYAEVDVTNGGTVRGVVKFTTTPPTRIIELNKDQEKCGHNSIPSERMRYDADNLTVANCVVYLADITEGKAWTGEMAKGEDDRVAVLDQKGCVYVPHVVTMRTNTQMVFKNSDPAEHNVHIVGKVNVLSPSGSELTPGLAFLETPGFYDIKCDIHAWMSGHAFVSAHPYFAVTGLDGKFELTNVPPGEYTLILWHEGMAENPQFGPGGITSYDYGKPVEQAHKVKVESGGAVELELSLTPPAN